MPLAAAIIPAAAGVAKSSNSAQAAQKQAIASAGSGADNSISGLMSPSGSNTSAAAAILSTPLQGNSYTAKDKRGDFPDNPALALALQAEKIFVPEVKGV